VATQTPPHRSVLPAEVLHALIPISGGTYVDCTVGAGGHAEALLDASAPDGRLIGIDADQDALSLSATRLSRFGDRVQLVHANYGDLEDVLAATGTGEVDGVLLDLGVSSMQLDQPDRGFSFQSDGPLDMRMDQTQGETAASLVNGLPERALADLIFTFGEERFSRRIARTIVARRAAARFETTAALAAAVQTAIPGRSYHGLHPATRTFQALRIAVNSELDGLTAVLPRAAESLKPGGRLAVISFHSLEDRIVKRFLQGNKESLLAVTRKPLIASAEEQRANPRSRSAKLRVAEKLAGVGLS